MTKKMYASFMGDKIKTFGNIQIIEVRYNSTTGKIHQLNGLDVSYRDSQLIMMR